MRKQQDQEKEQNNQDPMEPHELNSEEDEKEPSNQKWKKIQKPQKCLSLFMIDFNQCDSKKCTGRKMQRFSLLKSLKQKQKRKKFRGVVLSAFGDKAISVEDLDICLKYGICVIDCSWNRIEETSSFRYKNERILPYVVAGNPVNYGKPFQLSCVQALATALCGVGYIDQAEYIMSKFGWADGFWSINSRIKQYGMCKNSEELSALSKDIEEQQNTMKQRNYDISDSSKSSDEQQQQQQQQIKQDKNQQNIQKQKQQQPRQEIQIIQGKSLAST